MLSAVDLDHQSRSMAGEIDDEMAERDLVTPASLPRDGAQETPHRALCIRHLPAKPARVQDVPRGRVLLHAHGLRDGSAVP